MGDDIIDAVEDAFVTVQQRNEGDAGGDGGECGNAADQDEFLVGDGGVESFDDVITDHRGD